MTNFSKILVCYDGSKSADKALLNGITLAKKFNSKLMVLSVMETKTVDFWDNSKYVGIESSVLKKRKLLIKNILEKKIKKIKNKIQIQIFIVEGNVKNEIMKFIRKKSINLVVIGNRGFGRSGRFFLGSISNSISQESPCSILIIK